MEELDPNISAEAKRLCALGYEQYDQAQWDKALRYFYSAWNKLPKPQTDWKESGWILTAIGDTYFSAERFGPAKQALNSALHCPEIDYNPFVLLRLGQSLLELGENDKAHQTLALAHQRGGRELFKDEPPKYLLAAKQQAANI